MNLGPWRRRFRIALLPVVVSSAIACDADSTIAGVNGDAVGLTIMVGEEGANMPSAPGETLTLQVGESASLVTVSTNALGLTVSGSAVTWSAADYGVVEVTPDGVVTAVAPGSTDVFASAADALASLPVVVTAPEVVPPPAP